MAVPKRAERSGSGWVRLATGCDVGACGRAGASTENINLAADVVNSDLRNDIHVLSGNVRITQGEMSMEAETGDGHRIANRSQSLDIRTLGATSEQPMPICARTVPTPSFQQDASPTPP